MSSNKPNHNDPYVLDVAPLSRRAGELREISRTITTPARLGLDLIGIEAGTELDLDVTMQSVSEGVLVTGSAAADTVGQCSRCLDPIRGEVDVDITELFAYPNSETVKTTDDDEIGRIVDDLIDLEQVIIDLVGLELPPNPLCRPDCPGLCPTCGIKLADAEPGHSHDLIDPRWAKLQALAAESGPETGTASGAESDPRA